jgi:hypothetical protein
LARKQIVSIVSVSFHFQHEFFTHFVTSSGGPRS